MAKTWKDGVALRGTIWWIRVQHEGDRTSGFGSVKKFAFLLDPHQPVPTTRTAAVLLARRVKDWLVKGKPMPEPKAEPPAPTVELVGNDLFDRWLKQVEPFNPRGKKKEVVSNWTSKLKSAREAFGTTPLSDLGKKTTITAYVNGKLDEDYALATPNRILATIVRPAVLWGVHAKLMDANPFGKYGYMIEQKNEHRRTNRIDPALEYELLDVCGILGDGGRVLAEFLQLAIDTGGRHEYFALCNADVDWQASKLKFTHTKNGEVRFAPFNPHGRVAELLKRRRFAGPKARVLARADGEPVTTIWKVWVQAICLIKGIPYVCTREGISKETTEAYQEHELVPYLTRHEAATWWGEKKVTDESSKFVQGHRSQNDTHGRYMHAAYERARAELAEKVWPFEHERAVKAEPLEKQG